MTDSDVSMNLDGGDATWRTAMQPALDQNLMAKVVEKANMQKAWQRVKSNQGAPGSDGMALEDFPAYARLHWPTIRQSLLEGTYLPQPVRRVSIPVAQTPHAHPKAVGMGNGQAPCHLDGY